MTGFSIGWCFKLSKSFLRCVGYLEVLDGFIISMSHCWFVDTKRGEKKYERGGGVILAFFLLGDVHSVRWGVKRCGVRGGFCVGRWSWEGHRVHLGW